MERRPNRRLAPVVLAEIEAHPGSTVTSIASRLRLDTMPVGNALASLYRAGRICKSGMNKNAHKWFVVTQTNGPSTPTLNEDKDHE